MKRFFLGLTLILTFALLFGCAEECTEHKDENSDAVCDACGAALLPIEDGGEDEDDVKVEFVANGIPNFKFVLSSSVTADEVEIVDSLIYDLREKGIETERIIAKENNAEECEILIGDVSERGERYDIDEHTLGLKGYAIKLIDKKLVVAAGSLDSLSDALSALKKMIGRDSVTLSEADSVIKPQDSYRIEGISVNGKEISEHIISVDTSNKYMMSAAQSLQSSIYAARGYWLDIIDLNQSTVSSKIELLKVADAGSDGYRIRVLDNDLIIETEFPNKAESATMLFISRNIASVIKGKIDFDKKFSFTSEVRYVYYKDFAVYKDSGALDDFKTILATHNYANEFGHTVKGVTGDVFNLGKEVVTEIPIKTNVEWGGAVFKLNDKDVPVESNARTKNIFAVKSSFSDWSKTYTKSSPELAAIKDGFLASEIKNIGFAPGYRALVYVEDENNYAYNRAGTHATENLPKQRESVMVEADGTIIEGTGFLLDYTGVTTVRVYRADDKPIRISGGKFITDANNAPPVYTSYSRGIRFQRSNTTIANTVHEIIGEGDTGAPYSGFIRFEYTYNLRCENLVLQGHKTYQDYDYDENGNIVKVHSNMGTYDIGGSQSIGLYFYKCTQPNFFKEDGITPYCSTEYWGIMGTNYNKNITYDTCRLSRLDAHAGVLNVTIKNSEIVYISLIGGGTALIENTKVYNAPDGSDDKKQSMISLRSDYGSTWRGDLIIKDCVFVNGGQNSLINASWRNWDFGNYITHLPNVTIDNLEIINPSDEIYVFFGPHDSSKQLDLEVMKDGTKNLNPMHIAVNVTVKNNKRGYNFLGSTDNYVSNKISFCYNDEE